MSREVDTSTVGIISLNNSSSGGTIANAQQKINDNSSNISTNASDISTNASNISTNTSNISTNTSNISTNTSNISTNTTDISNIQNKVDNVIGSGSRDASSAFQIDSTTEGLLIPRMTTTERDNISTPSTSLLIFNITTGSYEFYNGSSWVKLSAGGGGTTEKVLYVKDIKSQGTNAQTLSSGTWNVRDLNTRQGDLTFSSLASNQITLNAGDYLAHWFCAHLNSTGTSRLRNVSDSTDIEQGATITANTNTLVVSQGFASFTLGVSKILELQHYVNSAAPTQGALNLTGYSEVYSQIRLIKVE